MLSQNLQNLPIACIQDISSKHKCLIMPDLNGCELKSAHIFLKESVNMKDLRTMLQKKKL